MAQDPTVEVMQAFNQFKEAVDQNAKKHSTDLDAKIDKISAKLDSYESINQKVVLQEATAKAQQEQLDKFQELIQRPGAGVQAEDHIKVVQAFDRVLRKPAHERDVNDMAMINNYNNSLVKFDDKSAGYLLAPPEMEREIIKKVIEFTPIRALATVRNIGGDSLKQPKKLTSGSASRIGEIQTRTNTGDPTYGMIEIKAPEMYARIEISQQMLEDAGYDMLAELREDASEQFAVKEGLEYVSGINAANQGEGILTNPDIPYTASGEAAALTADGLINLIYGIKTAYAPNALLGMNRATLGLVRKLKDGIGNYLWVPGIANAAPNTINGVPYVELPDMPDVAAGTYPIIYGDFRRGYKIVDRIGISFQVDFTTGADNGLVIFRARKRSGSAVVLPEAFRKLKIATS